VLSWAVSFFKIMLALFGKPGNPGGPELGGLVHQEANINQLIALICFAFLKHMQDTSMRGRPGEPGGPDDNDLFMVFVSRHKLSFQSMRFSIYFQRFMFGGRLPGDRSNGCRSRITVAFGAFGPAGCLEQLDDAGTCGGCMWLLWLFWEGWWCW